MQFSKQYDVIVAGGGIAGIAAALAAARRGVRTALIEKTILPGGLATAGLVIHYLPLCDGRGVQVSYGLAEAFLKAAIQYGPDDLPSDWQDPESPARYRTSFSAPSLMMALDELLEESGVELWYDTLGCLPLVRDGVIAGVEVENKSGRGVLEARVVIDATGDADIAQRAGVPCVEGDSLLSVWAVEASLDAAKAAVEQQDGFPLLSIYKKNGTESIEGISGRKMTDYVLKSRQLLRDHYRRVQHETPGGRRNMYPVSIPSLPGFRRTRCIVGEQTLAYEDAWRARTDAVGLMTHVLGPGGVQHDVWEVPFGALYNRKVRGLLVAGRCIAADLKSWEITRTIPAVAVSGEIAGEAAALAVRSGREPHALELDRLRRTLGDAGLKCTLTELYGEQLPIS